ncbi:MAG: replication-associated recombination protein A, partial [Oscillospiraceae bacterium]|nr:replication-associated recombination protein A [Oscillospiraceae bacterium]
MPLADKIRPETLADVVGQPHLIGENKPLLKIINSGKIPNMIFYGPSGVGKTTIARIIANSANMRLHKLNGTSASTADIKEIVGEIDTFLGSNGILLYLDEIQYLNKKQQQSLLEYIENGSITLIASTTENPYFYVYNAILSRCTVFEFKPVEPNELEKAVRRGFSEISKENGGEYEVSDEAVNYICHGVGGDVRKCLNTVELCALSAENGRVDLELAKELTQRSNMRYDRDGDQHYDLLSALQKSIRGSDENAALHYAARLIDAGDIISLSRRLLVIAAEDIGLAYPQAIPIVKACVDSAMQLGLPEARIPLGDAVILLATSPKSNSGYNAINEALADVKNGATGDFPRHLQNKHFDGEGAEIRGQNYLYPHDFPNHYIKQQYLPDNLKD